MLRSVSNDSPTAAVEQLLSEIAFEPLHSGWLPTREAELQARLAELSLDGELRVLLVNATLGPQLYPSIVDFFVTASRVIPGLQAHSVSYYDHIYEYGRQVVKKGLSTSTVDELARWDDELDRFDVVLAIGPSDALIALMERPELRPKLVLLDLGFYHQQIDATDRALLGWDYQRPGRSAQVQPVTCWTCQPVTRVARVLDRILKPSLLSYRRFNYIPIGFRYAGYYGASEKRFDLALLGSANRHHDQLDEGLLAGLRLLSLGGSERAVDLERLAASLDVTVAPRVDSDAYAQLLATCRCVVLPLGKDVESVLLSAIDALGSGVPLVTKRCVAFGKLEAEGAPLVLGDSSELSTLVAELLADEPRRAELAERSLAFARSHLDIYRVLEQLLGELA